MKYVFVIIGFVILGIVAVFVLVSTCSFLAPYVSSFWTKKVVVFWERANEKFMQIITKEIPYLKNCEDWKLRECITLLKQNFEIAFYVGGFCGLCSGVSYVVWKWSLLH